MSVGNVYSRGWVPHTCIAMSSTIRISSTDGRDGVRKQIGVVQSFKPTDTRRTERARGVGYGDRVAEIVPAMTDTSITCTRMALYDRNILEVFGYHSKYNQGGNNGAVRSLSHMKNPFDIDEIIWFHKDGPPGGQYTITIYHDSWINNWSRTIDITGNLILMEDVTIDVTWVSDGIEPGPYAKTDFLDEHGLDCSNRQIHPGLSGAFAAGLTGDPGGDGTRSGGTSITS